MVGLIVSMTFFTREYLNRFDIKLFFTCCECKDHQAYNLERKGCLSFIALSASTAIQTTYSVAFFTLYIEDK